MKLSRLLSLVLLSISPLLAQNETVNGNLTVTGTIGAGGIIDSAANEFIFGTQSGSNAVSLLYSDFSAPTSSTDTLKFSLNRISASWLWAHATDVTNPTGKAMRLDSAHQLILYQANGTTAGVTLTPATNQLSLGTATLTGSGTGLTAGGAFTATGTLTSTTGGFASNAGINLTAGGTDQDITLTPSGAGDVILNGNVGIGTSTPAEKLDVRGNIVIGPATRPTLRFKTTGVTAAGRIVQPIADATGRIDLTANLSYDGTSWFRDDTTQRGRNLLISGAAVQIRRTATGTGAATLTTDFHIDDAGKIGVGTTAPSVILDILKGTANDVFQIKTADTNPSRLAFGNSGSLWYISATRTGTGAYQPLAFLTSGLERLRIDTAGNVGIGASPTAKLDVLGSSRFVTDTGFYGTRIGSVAGGDSYVWLGSRVNVPVIQGNNGAFGSILPLALQAEGGNVGIGTTTPNYALSFGSTLGKVFALFESNGTNLYGMSAGGAGTGADPYRTKIFANGGERMSLISDGNVGIGTATPYAKLAAVGTISAGSASGAAAGTNTATLAASASKAQLYLIRSVGTWSDTWWDWTHDSDNKLKLGFSTVPQAEFANGQVSFLGNVGIGVSSPGLKLDVAGPIRSTAGAIDVRLQAGAAGAAGVGSFSNDPLLLISAGVERARITTTGNIGIGTTGPQSRLHVFSAASGSSYVQYPTIALLENNADTGLAFMTPVANKAYIGHATPLDGGSAFIMFDGTARAMSFSTVNGTERMRIDQNGNVGIGTAAPTHKLSVKGTIRAQEIIVDNTNWADYVFEEDYRLAPLAEVESHIKAKGHLPGIPSAAEVAEHGVSMGDMQARLLSKVEELTLHLIRMEKENAALRDRVQALETTAVNP